MLLSTEWVALSILAMVAQSFSCKIILEYGVTKCQKGSKANLIAVSLFRFKFLAVYSIEVSIILSTNYAMESAQIIDNCRSQQLKLIKWELCPTLQ